VERTLEGLTSMTSLPNNSASSMKLDSKYISYLDGLRGYAIFFVLLGHFYIIKLTFAQVGVTLFFFISGFLITKLLILEYNVNNRIILKDFYLRRVFRLYPALLFMVLLYCIVVLLFGFRIITEDILSGLFYYTNYYLVYFKPAATDPRYLYVSPILWSLSVEEHFYLVFPVLFTMLFAKGRQLVVALVVCILLVLVARILTQSFFIAYYTTHCRADSILFGCLSALLIYSHQTSWYINILQSKFSFYAGAILVVASMLFRNIFFQETFVYTFEGLGFLLLVPSFLFMTKENIIHKFVNNKVSIFVGKLSYSVYLFHWVALQIGILFFPERSLKWFLLVVPTSIILALISYFFVEKPFIALRRRFGSHAKA
jgi:peptidoglycan/LPS O-acetylase OafA/YrhL